MNNQRASDDPNPSEKEGFSAIGSVDYDEFKPDTYRGVKFHIYEHGKEVMEKQFFWKSDVSAFLGAFHGKVTYTSSVFDFEADGGLIPEKN